jgi:ribosomal protein L14E/L6E/L27E
LHYAQLALSNARAELQGERAHSASLYNVLHNTKCKLKRTAKIQALEQAMEAMELVEKTKNENIQLTEEKDELEDRRISELLQDVQLAKEKRMESRKKV